MRLTAISKKTIFVKILADLERDMPSRYLYISQLLVRDYIF